MKYDLSIIIPSIRVANLAKIHFMIEQAMGPYSFQMIVVGPYDLPQDIASKENVKFMKDFGSPSRCVQMGSTIAEGTYMCWMSDDCTFITPQSLGQCIQVLEGMTEKDGMTLRYFEGDGNGEFPLDYWRAKHHGDMQALAGVSDTHKIAPLGMYRTSYFRQIGGLDCRWEHINMCTHDLAFRVQNAGGIIAVSPSTVARFYWSWHTADAKPVQRAYFETDSPLFKEVWSQDQSQRIQIDYWNWMNMPDRWGKRFA